MGGDYVGIDVHRAARICSAAHGGQVVISEATERLAGRSTRRRSEPAGSRRASAQGPQRSGAAVSGPRRWLDRGLPAAAALERPPNERAGSMGGPDGAVRTRGRRRRSWLGSCAGLVPSRHAWLDPAGWARRRLAIAAAIALGRRLRRWCSLRRAGVRLRAARACLGYRAGARGTDPRWRAVAIRRVEVPRRPPPAARARQLRAARGGGAAGRRAVAGVPWAHRAGHEPRAARAWPLSGCSWFARSRCRTPRFELADRARALRRGRDVCRPRPSARPRLRDR